MLRKSACVIALALLFLLGSCSDKSLRVIDVPSTPVLTRSLGWAVVEVAYAQVYDSPGASGVVLGYYRKGVILPIVERRIEQTKTDAVLWVRNEGSEPGWIREGDIRVYDSEAKAKTAVGSMNL